MSELDIRAVRPDEAPELLELSRKTFFDAFYHRNKPEDMAIYADAAFRLDKITAELDNPNSYFFFYTIDNEPVGYMKLNRAHAQTDLYEDAALEIERIYVDAAHQGKQIGARLLQFAIAQARNWQAKYVWLGVWEHNTQAIKFYQRYGFAAFGSHLFMLGNDKQTDVLMKFSLGVNTLPEL